MAKGNLFLGTSYGKIGDIVTYRKFGAQVTRAYVPNPVNPKTDKQMIKRVRWASLQPTYATNKTLIGQTFTELLKNTSAQRQFFKANYNKTPLIEKEVNEYYKNTGKFPPAPYTFSKGVLSWFPEQLIYRFEDLSGEESGLTFYFNALNIISYLNAKAKGETKIKLSLGELIGASLYNTPYEGERIGFMTSRIEREGVYNTFVCSKLNYYETTPEFFADDLILFSKSGEVWSMAAGTEREFTNMFDAFTLHIDLPDFCYLTLRPNATIESWGYGSFRVRPTEKAVSNCRFSLKLDSDAKEYLQSLTSDEHIQKALDSYRNEPVLLQDSQIIIE